MKTKIAQNCAESKLREAKGKDKEGQVVRQQEVVLIVYHEILSLDRHESCSDLLLGRPADGGAR